jgi:hypothetical protein
MTPIPTGSHVSRTGHDAIGGDGRMRLSYTLSDYPHDVVEIECDKCGRHSGLRTAKLLGPSARA